VRALLAAYRNLAERLDLEPASGPEARVSLAELRQAELGCLRRWQTDAEVGRGAIAAWWR
jgi:hypothetical protein